MRIFTLPRIFGLEGGSHSTATTPRRVWLGVGLGLGGDDSGNNQGIRERSGNIQGTFRELAGNI
jgi:hypothetical protein